MFYKRAIEQAVRSINDTFPVMILTGPRQVGKTTLLQYMAEKERKYVALDNPTDRALAKSDPEHKGKVLLCLQDNKNTCGTSRTTEKLG